MSCGSIRHKPISIFDVIRIPSPFGLWGRVGARLLRLYERQQQRRHLRELDDRMLEDIGLTRAEAEAEARKPFWR